jgi:hypothetical protein
MDEVGPGFQPASAFQALLWPLISKAAQKHGWQPTNH